MRQAESTRPAGGSEPRLAKIAAMIADPARSRMLSYLLDGHYASASELAKAAGVSASTASGHLGKMVETGLLVREQRGRHRYFRLADAEVAHTLEALALLAERATHERNWSDPGMVPLRYARRCYGHLAGELGVLVFNWLIRERALEMTGAGTYGYRAAGEAAFASIGFDPGVVKRDGRLAYPCLDWSERRDHLAGNLATALLNHFIAMRWLTDARTASSNDSSVLPLQRQSHRCLALTATGRTELLPILLAPVLGKEDFPDGH
ncbi:ArsR/SmtB family transcription factor [Burkholderia glumae]|uniref:ArsR/SmtB family transcription factor n=2 Tax=Burkholderia glumae TaxID=337 RepID=UPI002151735A|nr:winged helix-turn-helix domain-containing protein [Burkholderia glumae]